MPVSAKDQIRLAAGVVAGSEVSFSLEGRRTVHTCEQHTVWCLVGNIVDGPEVHPHFSQGTKVYCFPPVWGDGFQKIVVIGRHRGSRSMVRMVISRRWVKKLKAQVVYSPSVLKLLAEPIGDRTGSSCWRSEEEVRQFIANNEPSWQKSCAE